MLELAITGFGATWERYAAGSARRIGRFSYRYLTGLLLYYLAKAFSRLTGIVTITSRLRARDLTAGIDYGWVGYRCVTQVGAIALMTEWYNGPNVMKNFTYQNTGTSSTAESSTDTALLAEVEARTNSTIYRNGGGNSLSIVSEHTYAGIYALREHGVFDAATLGSMFDRTVFAQITTGVGTVIEWTYEVTANYGS